MLLQLDLTGIGVFILACTVTGLQVPAVRFYALHCDTATTITTWTTVQNHAEDYLGTLACEPWRRETMK